MRGGLNFGIDFTGNTISGNAGGAGVDIRLNDNAGTNFESNIQNNTISNNGGQGVNLALSQSINANIQDFSGNTINGNGGSTRYGYYFDFSGSALTDPLLATSYTLSTVGLNNSVSGWSFATGSSISATGGSGFSNASYAVSGDPLYNFQLSTAAVPEPGTLALGALAAIAGAVAFYFRLAFGQGA